MPAGSVLRIDTLDSALVHWSVDAWRPVHDTPRTDTTIGVHVADLDTVTLRKGGRVNLTFYWPDRDRWEGTDFLVWID